jgi:putative ABC transport system ATP-binding protein
MRDLAIDARGVQKSYGTGALATPVLRGIDFSVDRGEVVMLAGPSGSGKTTLLSLFGCVLSPTAGTIALFGDTVSGLAESELPAVRLAYIGFVFQGHNLVASMSATENVVFQLELRGWSAKDATREAHRLLERVGLADRRDHLPGELSGGQRQRVAIARAIAGSPPLVLADEPTASLDAESGLGVMNILRALAREQQTTAVIVTHDARIFHFADRVEHIEDGRMVAAPRSGPAVGSGVHVSEELGAR